jgi:deoxyribonuclease-4
MPLLGAHMSISGGLHLAFDRIGEVRGEALQIFTKNQKQWLASPLNEDVVKRFLQSWEESGRIPMAAHDSYLINLAAEAPDKCEKSVAAFAEELLRAERLRIPYLIMHPGAHVGSGVEVGLERFVVNLDRAFAISGTSGVTVVIETTAGQGSSLGSTFDEIAFILSSSRFGGRLGVCFDTCHAFAAGYDIRTEASYRETFSRFDAIIGLDRLRFFHLNDSKRGLGSRVDRHEHIGKGKIGRAGFRRLLNDPRFRHHPMVLETPKGKDLREDKENLRVLRSLLDDYDGPRE